MTRRGFGIGRKDKWALNCFQSCISALVKATFIRQGQLFLIPQRFGMQHEWHKRVGIKGPTHPPILSSTGFFISRRRSPARLEIKRILCSRFIAICLWTQTLGTQFHLAQGTRPFKRLHIRLWVQHPSCPTSDYRDTFKKFLQIPCQVPAGTNSKYSWQYWTALWTQKAGPERVQKTLNLFLDAKLQSHSQR